MDVCYVAKCKLRGRWRKKLFTLVENNRKTSKLILYEFVECDLTEKKFLFPNKVQAKLFLFIDSCLPMRCSLLLVEIKLCKFYCFSSNSSLLKELRSMTSIDKKLFIYTRVLLEQKLSTPDGINFHKISTITSLKHRTSISIHFSFFKWIPCFPTVGKILLGMLADYTEHSSVSCASFMHDWFKDSRKNKWCVLPKFHYLIFNANSVVRETF